LVADDEIIAGLPVPWPSDRDVNAHPAEGKRYADLHEELTVLSTKRAVVRERVERLRRMREVLASFSATAGAGGVQENLVTRGGDVEKALERMRLLLVRVGGRLANLEQGGEEMDHDEDVDVTKDEVQTRVDQLVQNL
jgi:hypothetical protein